MVFQDIVRGAYDMALNAQMSGFYRSDLLLFAGGLAGAVLLFYGSKALPARMKMVDARRPTEYISPQIEALRCQLMNPFRPLF